MTIYNELAEFESVLDDMLEASSGEVTPEIEDLIQYHEQTKLECFERLGKVYFGKQAGIKSLDEEIKRLKDLKDKRENNFDRLKNYILFLSKGEKIETATCQFSSRKSTSVNIIDETLIPSQFTTPKIEIKADKKAIGDALKNGQAVAGCELLENINLSVK